MLLWWFNPPSTFVAFRLSGWTWTWVVAETAVLVTIGDLNKEGLSTGLVDWLPVFSFPRTGNALTSKPATGTKPKLDSTLTPHRSPRSCWKISVMRPKNLSETQSFTKRLGANSLILLFGSGDSSSRRSNWSGLIQVLNCCAGNSSWR